MVKNSLFIHKHYTPDKPNQRAIISPQRSQNMRPPFMDLGYVHEFNTHLGRHETQTTQTACDHHHAQEATFGKFLTRQGPIVC